MMLSCLVALVAPALGFSASPSSLPPATVALEDALLELCVSRAAPTAIADAVAACEAAGGLTDAPARSPLIEGAWELLHTSKSEFDPTNPLGRRLDGSSPGLEGFIAKVTGGDTAAAASSSPIQRAVTDAFKVTQTLTRLESGSGRVEQLVSTPLGELHLNAAARPDAADGRRVRFGFDEGYFLTEGGLRLPYPVPFKLLGKEAEGYLDTSFLGERLRVSTGNKGTTFVLRRLASAAP